MYRVHSSGGAGVMGSGERAGGSRMRMKRLSESESGIGKSRVKQVWVIYVDS
jgi:hypothetical protein